LRSVWPWSWGRALGEVCGPTWASSGPAWSVADGFVHVWGCRWVCLKWYCVFDAGDGCVAVRRWQVVTGIVGGREVRVEVTRDVFMRTYRIDSIVEAHNILHLVVGWLQ
jgi:hypothetical protein